MNKSLVALLTMLSAITPALAETYPLTVQSCGQPVTITQRPTHAVIQDVNMAEMAFALHLQPFIAGLSGISGWSKKTPEFSRMQGNIPEIATHYPSLEQLLAARADLFIAGWNYGMHVGGDVTPETLQAQGIPTLVLSESCIRTQTHPKLPTLSLLYDDEYRMGRVFDRTAEATALINGWKQRISAVEGRIANTKPKSVFIYDSGEDRPFTAGAYALASEIVRLGGGVNIFNDLQTNWGPASWESAALRDADAIIIVDYGAGTQKSRAFLEHHPLMSDARAIRTKNVLALRYDELTPGPENIGAVEKIAHFLHPDINP